MRRTLINAALVGLPLVAALVMLNFINSNVFGQSAIQKTGPVAIKWVPFSATGTYTDEEGKVHHTRIYRASNGSERTESFDPATGHVYGIMIKNIARVKFYDWLEPRGWTEQPMILPPGGWHPPQSGPASDGQTRELIDGYEVLRSERPNAVVFEAPQLDMYRLRYDLRKCGNTARTCTSRVSGVKIGEPAGDLFEPPPGVPVLSLSEPGGIVFTPKP